MVSRLSGSVKGIMIGFHYWTDLNDYLSFEGTTNETRIFVPDRLD
jgi:hypothetical protein